MPENNIRSVKQKHFTPPATSPTELTTYIGTPPPLIDGAVVPDPLWVRVSINTGLFAAPIWQVRRRYALKHTLKSDLQHIIG